MQRKSTQVHIKCVVFNEARGKFKKCQLCSKDFGLFVKEHQCKRCRRAVCQNCASHHGPVLSEGGFSKQSHRICNFCKDESDSIKRFIEQYKIGLGKDTFSVDWLKASGLTVEIAKKEYEMASKENDRSKDKSEFLKMKQELQMVMLEFWINLTYSLREFLHYLLKDGEHEQLQQMICRVLGALLISYPEIGYCADQVLITAFLLCFCSEAAAFSLLTILYADVIPPYSYPANLRKTPYDYNNEVEQIIQVMDQAFKIKASELQGIKPFLRTRVSRYLQPLGINFFQFQTQFFFFNLIFLTPKNGYDNFIKCLAVSFQNQFEEIKMFLNSLEDAEAQILKSVRSVQCEKDFLLTKVIIFLPQKRVTQSVVIQKLSELVKQTKSIAPEHPKQEEIQVKIQTENKMMEYAVVQNKEFQDLRRKSVEAKANPEADEEKANLKQYIEKVEEALMLKHKLVTELQNKIKELQNQSLSVTTSTSDANDQQLAGANEQLRKRVQEYEFQISQLEEQQKFSIKLQEESQEMVVTIQRTNKDLEQQLETQMKANKDLYAQNKELRTQLQTLSQQGQSPTISPTRERNFQINIQLLQKQNEEQLQSKLDQEQQKVILLQQQINQLNKDYLGLQQLNQDKLKIIGNLEVKLIEFDTVTKENERLTFEIAQLLKKIEHHELVIVQQQDQYDDLKEKYDDLVRRFEVQGEEMDQVRIEKRQNLEEYNRKENELLLIIQDLRKRLQEANREKDELQEQLNRALEVNQSNQKLIMEKDETIKLLESGIAKGLKKFAELEAKHHKQMEDDKKTIEERDQVINQLNQQIQDLQERLNQAHGQIQQLEQHINEKNETIRVLEAGIAKGLQKFAELDAKHKQQIEDDLRTIQEREQTIEQRNNLIQDLENKISQLEKLVSEKNETIKLLELGLAKGVQKYGELDARYKKQMEDDQRLIQDRDQTINQLNKQLQDLDSNYKDLYKRHTDLDGDHNQLKEKYRILIIEFEQVKGNTNEKMNELKQQIEDLQKQLKLWEEKYNQLNKQHQGLIARYEEDQQNHIKRVGEFELRILDLGKKVYEYKTLSENQQIEIDNLKLRIKELEDLIAQKEREQEERHKQLLRQITIHLEKLTLLENNNSKLELNVSDLEKRIQELLLYNQDYKNQIIKQDERIMILIKEGQSKEQDVIKLIQLIEKQKLDLIDYEKIIRELRERIVELEKIIVQKEKRIGELEIEKKKLQALVIQFKSLSEEMAQIS